MPRLFPILLARIRDALLSPNPPRELSARALALYAVIALIVCSGFGRGTVKRYGGLRFLAQWSPAQGWSVPPVAGTSDTLDVELFVSEFEGWGWTSREIRFHPGAAMRGPTSATWAGVFGVWKARLDAADASTTHSTGVFSPGPLTLKDQQAVLVSLVAHEASLPSPPGVPGSFEVTDGVFMQASQRVIWVIPAALLAAVPFLAAYRASRGAVWRAEFLLLSRGTCPKCRYDRSGLDSAAPCPECGCDPARLEAEYAAFLKARAARRA